MKGRYWSFQISMFSSQCWFQQILPQNSWILNQKLCEYVRLWLRNNSNKVLSDWAKIDAHRSSKLFNLQTAITSGNFKTTSDFWVGNIPFKILCGCPWQVQNKINIEEQNDGTWLSHRAVTGEAVWEVYAVPAQNPVEDGINSHLFGHHHHHHCHNHHCHHHHPFHHAETHQKPPPEDNKTYAYTWLLNPTQSRMMLN